jgi:hypothetical protein
MLAMLGSMASSLPVRSARSAAFVRFLRTASLGDSARKIYLDAKTEKLPIAVVAERAAAPDSPTKWFADSMLKVMPVYRKVDGGYEEVDVVGQQESLEELYVRRRDCRNYMRWARTLQ